MISLKMEWNGGSSTKAVAPTESDVFKAIGEQLLNIKRVPNELTATCEYGDARFHIIQRGSYTENGVVYPSMFVDQHSNNMYGLTPSLYPEKKLTCIHPESNNYKFYTFKPINTSTQTIEVSAEYGRLKDGADGSASFGNFWEMGARTLKTPFPSYMYWVRYYEKLSKGYKDFSDILLDDTEDTDDTVEIDSKDDGAKKESSKGKKKKQPTQASIELFELLMKAAEETVEKNLSENTKITQKQIKAVSELLSKLGECETVKDFNDTLRDILMLSPRKARDIAYFFAEDTDDFDRIIAHEENILNAMKMVYMKKSKPYKESKDVHSFDDFGVKVYYASDWQTEHVKKRIPKEHHPYIDKIYRVIPRERKKAFDAYVKTENIKKCKEVFHASDTANFGGKDGITVNGLRLRNKSKTTHGQMLGPGTIYFSWDFNKCFDYSSSRRAYHAGSTSNIAIVGMFNLACGNIYEERTQVMPVTKEFLRSKGYNSVAAYKGAKIGGYGRGLYRDEIAVHYEDASVLMYLIVMRT